MADQPMPGRDPGMPGPGPGAGFAAGGALDALAPGPALARSAHEAFGAGLAGLSDDELVGFVSASRRLASWATALELAAVATIDGRRRAAAGRPGWSGIGEHVSDELAAALVLTSRSADVLLGLARDLARMPGVAAALLAGRIDKDRAAVFAAELAGLGDVAAAAVAAAFCGVAGAMTTGQLRAALRSMVLMVDPQGARRRAERGRADARLERWAEGSGNAALAGRELPPAEAIAADERISAIARALKTAGAPGSLDQIRARVFVALLAGRDPRETLPVDRPGEHASSPDSPRPDSPRPDSPRPDSPRPGQSGWLAGISGSVHLTMPLSAWLGMDDSPGEAAGHGPLDADTCRDLAAQLAAGPGARWCVTLTDEEGLAAAHACARTAPVSPGPQRPPGPRPPGPRPPGPLRAAWLAGLRFTCLENDPCTHARRGFGYQPTNLVRHLVKVRQRRCSYPGCRRPATRCDLDHTVPWDAGGLTCECNLAPLCRGHHRAKQAPGWTLTQPRPGVLTWSLPHGRTYTTAPEPYPV